MLADVSINSVTMSWLGKGKCRLGRRSRNLLINSSERDDDLDDTDTGENSDERIFTLHRISLTRWIVGRGYRVVNFVLRVGETAP